MFTLVTIGSMILIMHELVNEQALYECRSSLGGACYIPIGERMGVHCQGVKPAP